MSPSSSGFFFRNRDTILLEVMIGALFTGLVGFAFLAFQERQEVNRTERAEMLADLAYVRETLRDGGPKEFRGLNLRGANLSGLDLGCDPRLGDHLMPDIPHPAPLPWDRLDQERRSGCALFSETDFTGANLSGTDLTGAILEDVVFRPSNSFRTSLVGAHVSGDIDALLIWADLRFADLSWGYSEHQPGTLSILSGAATGASFSSGEGAVQLEGVDVSGLLLFAADGEIQLGQGCYYVGSTGSKAVVHQCESVRAAWLSAHVPARDSMEFANSRLGKMPRVGCRTNLCDTQFSNVTLGSGSGYQFPRPSRDALDKLKVELAKIDRGIAKMSAAEFDSTVRAACDTSVISGVDRAAIELAQNRNHPLFREGVIDVPRQVVLVVQREAWCKFHQASTLGLGRSGSTIQ